MIFVHQRFQISSRLSIQDLYVIKRIFKLTLASRGSHCRLFNIGVIWSELRAPVIIRAADNSVIMV